MKKVPRESCSHCGSQRDESGAMKHGEECRWHTAVDVRYTEDREETVIFVPYMPKGLL